MRVRLALLIEKINNFQFIYSEIITVLSMLLDATMK